MQSKITRYFVVGLLAVTLAGAGLITKAQAQWAPVGLPYRAAVYPAAHVYPSYVAWRPFGGLFAGLHQLLCPLCHHSPCCCVRPYMVPMVYDPCCSPCFDSCCTVCGMTDTCDCTSGFAFYEQPASKTMGLPSPTSFGSVTPSDGVPGQRPVGTTSSRTQTQGIVSSPSQPLTTGTQQQSPITSGASRPANQPTVAPPQNQATTSVDDFDSRIDIKRNDSSAPGSSSSLGFGGFSSHAADVPPTTGTTAGYGTFSNPASTSESNWTNMPGPETAQPGEAHTTPNGGFPQPVGAPAAGTPGTEAQPNSGSSMQNRKIDLGTGLISVTVPEHSKVYINGYETRMTGVNRKFVVNDLEPGMQYDYDVKIVANVDGRPIEESHHVTLSGGQQDSLVFGQPKRQWNDLNSSYIAARPVQ